MAIAKSKTKAETEVKLENRKLALGVDLGNYETKTSKGYRVKSKLRYGIDELDQSEDIYRIEYEDESWIIGKGESYTIDSRYFTKQYKIMLLNAIASSFEESFIDVDLTLGLPIHLFRQKDFAKDVKKFISNYGTNKIKVNGIEKTIKIESVNVWLEGGILFYNYDIFKNEKFLVVDIGGYSVDILAIENEKIVGNDSLTTGMYSLSNDILMQVNSRYDSDIRDGQVLIDAFLKNEEFPINGNNIEMKLVDAMLENYTNGLLSKLNQQFPLKTYKIKFIGGGSRTLEKYIQMHKNIYQIEVLGAAEFVNAYVYENISLSNN